MQVEIEDLIPAREDPAVPSPLTPEDVDELKHATLWSTAKTMAVENLKWGLTGKGRFEHVWARDLANMAAAEEAGLDKATLRSAIVEFFLYQDESGLLPGAVGEVKGNWPAGQTRSLPVNAGRVALFNGGGTANELWMVLAVCDYFRGTGDKSILQEIIGGKRMNQRVFDAMESVFREGDRDVDNLVLDRNPGALLDGCGQAMDPRGASLRLNLLAVITINAFIKLPDLRLEMVNQWVQRRKALNQAIRDVFWIEEDCKLLPRAEADTNAVAHRNDYAGEFFAVETAMAAEAGVLTPGETARSVAATLRVFHQGSLEHTGTALSKRNCPLVTSMVARAYAGSGFPGHAMELLRDVAERALRNGGFCQGCPRRNEPRGSGHFRSAASMFLNALHHLGHSQLVAIHPMSHHFAPPSASQPLPQVSAFGRVASKRFTFKPIPYNEKRELIRLDLEMPMEFHQKGGWTHPHKTLPGGALHPSEAGLAIESKEPLDEGGILEMVVQAHHFGVKKPFRLRGRIRWCKAKIASKLFLAGVELDARSKDLKRWRAFIKSHTPEKKA